MGGGGLQQLFISHWGHTRPFMTYPTPKSRAWIRFLYLNLVILVVNNIIIFRVLITNNGLGALLLYRKRFNSWYRNEVLGRIGVCSHNCILLSGLWKHEGLLYHHKLLDLQYRTHGPEPPLPRLHSGHRFCYLNFTFTTVCDTAIFRI